jgi:hypothetical protein
VHAHPDGHLPPLVHRGDVAGVVAEQLDGPHDLRALAVPRHLGEARMSETTSCIMCRLSKMMAISG